MTLIARQSSWKNFRLVLLRIGLWLEFWHGISAIHNHIRKVGGRLGVVNKFAFLGAAIGFIINLIQYINML